MGELTAKKDQSVSGTWYRLGRKQIWKKWPDIRYIATYIRWSRCAADRCGGHIDGVRSQHFRTRSRGQSRVLKWRCPLPRPESDMTNQPPPLYRRYYNWQRKAGKNAGNCTVSCEFLWIRRTCDYIFGWVFTIACCLAVGLGLGLVWIRSSVWLVSFVIRNTFHRRCTKPGYHCM